MLKEWYGILDRRIGSGKGVTALKKVALDQGLFAPCFLGVFLSVLGITQGNTIPEVKQHIKDNYKDIILVNWSVSYPFVSLLIYSSKPNF